VRTRLVVGVVVVIMIAGAAVGYVVNNDDHGLSSSQVADRADLAVVQSYDTNNTTAAATVSLAEELRIDGGLNAAVDRVSFTAELRANDMTPPLGISIFAEYPVLYPVQTATGPSLFTVLGHPAVPGSLPSPATDLSVFREGVDGWQCLMNLFPVASGAPAQELTPALDRAGFSTQPSGSAEVAHAQEVMHEWLAAVQPGEAASPAGVAVADSLSAELRDSAGRLRGVVTVTKGTVVKFGPTTLFTAEPVLEFQVAGGVLVTFAVEQSVTLKPPESSAFLRFKNPRGFLYAPTKLAKFSGVYAAGVALFVPSAGKAEVAGATAVAPVQLSYVPWAG
jgi:hypothetical protein